MTVLAALTTALAVALILTKWRFASSDRPRPRGSDPVPGTDVTVFQFWASVTAVAVMTFLSIFALTGLVVVAAVPALVVGSLPRAYLGRKRGKRLDAVQQAWPDGLRDIISSVRSGASLPSAIEDVASFGPQPLREAFQGFGVYARGLGVVRALEMVKEDLADPTSDRVIEVLILAYERGGSVVPEILADLAEATTKDLWTLEQVKSEALEQKINSRVVFVLPWLVLVAMTSQSGAFREFYSTPVGVAVVALGGALSLFGMAVATRLGRRPSEPRVFGGVP
ncbi:MAG: hypothetical protein R3258_07295 [Acidimicrobiia bacterium]|nr:hypothetical protein [Acidimicrobiia bacterium]